VLVSALNVDPKPCPEPDVLVLDPVLASPSHELAKKRKKGYELNRHFQDSWAAKLPWTEAVVGVDGRITQVRCKVCSDVKRREHGCHADVFRRTDGRTDGRSDDGRGGVRDLDAL
jgi:hypothetical protein